MSPQSSNKLYKAGLNVLKHLVRNGHKAFFVGGIVRDEFLKRESNNLDIATDALPDEIEKILNESGIHNKPVGKKFGSILAIVDKFPVEITTFRSEGRYSDKRHPDQVRFIKEYLDDAKRRDFTINALYFDPVKKELFDPTSGVRDLKLKILRSVGIEMLDKCGLLKFLIPEMEAIKTFFHKSKMYHLEGSIFIHTLLALSKTKQEPLELLYALLFHDIGKPQQAKKVLKKEGWVISTKGHADVSADIFLKFAEKLKFPTRSLRTIEWLIRNHMLM